MAQTKEWTRLCGTATTDCGYGVAADAGKNVYVAGNTYGALDSQPFTGVYNNLCLVKYDSSGTKQWTRLTGSDSGCAGNGVAVDGGGNVYVAGYTKSALDGQPYAGGSTDICLVKYDNTGTKQWTRLFGTPGYDFAWGISADGGKNVYVTGYTSGALDGQPYAGNNDVFLVKYDSSGTKQWTRLCGSAGSDVGYGVAVDGSGNVYVTGETTGALDGQPNAGLDDIFLVKYDSSGTKLWTRLCGTASSETGYGVAVDAGRNVYVTGMTWGALDGQQNAGAIDIFLVKYDSSGTKQWTRLCGSAGDDEGFGVAIDEGKNVYVSGVVGDSLDGQQNAGSGDICLVKYDSGGTKQWTRLTGSAREDEGRGIAIDGGGNVYVAGVSGSALDGQSYAGGSYDICLVKYIQRTQVLPFIARSIKKVMAKDIQMFDIFGRKISNRALSRRPAGIYIARSKAASFCEIKMLVK